MVISATETRNLDLDVLTPGSHDDNPEVTLPIVDLVSQLPTPDQPEHKPGGPLDRNKWRESWAPVVGNAAYKLLDILCNYANAEGICWPSRAALAAKSGLPLRTLDRSIAELKQRGAVNVISDGCAAHTSNTWQLTGGLNEWVATATGGKGLLPPVARGLLPPVANRTLSSSNPKKEPRRSGVSLPDKGPEPATAGARFDEMGGRRKEKEGRGRSAPQPAQKPSRMTEPTDSAPEPPPPASARDKAIGDWMAANFPSVPSFAFANAMVRRYWQWWSAPNNPKGWRCSQAGAVEHYTASLEHWNQLKRDLPDKIAKGGIPEVVPTAEAPQEPIDCRGFTAVGLCGNLTTKPKAKMTYGGAIVADGCEVCQ